MAVFTAPLTNSMSHLRPYHSGRDARAATDLVELCFADTLDPDGRSYLRRLHQSSHHKSFLDWISLFEPVSLPRSGYVWEEDNCLVGYLSLIPFLKQYKSCYLIANVAVHPDFRGRGIGRSLTHQAVEHARKRRAEAAWLQVNAENSSAVHIYKAEGFVERAQRTNWESAYSPTMHSAKMLSDHHIRIRPRHVQDWKLQQAWLKNLYPTELTWHLSIDQKAFKPGFTGSLYRFINWIYPQHWVAISERKPLGMLSYLPSDGHADTLWLALPTLDDDIDQTKTISTLLHYARRNTPRKRPLNINLPTNLKLPAMQKASFYPKQTLLWMEYKF